MLHDSIKVHVYDEFSRRNALSQVADPQRTPHSLSPARSRCRGKLDNRANAQATADLSSPARRDGRRQRGSDYVMSHHDNEIQNKLVGHHDHQADELCFAIESLPADSLDLLVDPGVESYNKDLQRSHSFSNNKSRLHLSMRVRNADSVLLVFVFV